ncbi:hypothetical protein T439DRAFT_327059 [Meredithblackwellia eburnea MCA 4105]
MFHYYTTNPYTRRHQHSYSPSFHTRQYSTPITVVDEVLPFSFNPSYLNATGPFDFDQFAQVQEQRRREIERRVQFENDVQAEVERQLRVRQAAERRVRHIQERAQAARAARHHHRPVFAPEVEWHATVYVQDDKAATQEKEKSDEEREHEISERRKAAMAEQRARIVEEERRAAKGKGKETSATTASNSCSSNDCHPGNFFVRVMLDSLAEAANATTSPTAADDSTSSGRELTKLTTSFENYKSSFVFPSFLSFSNGNHLSHTPENSVFLAYEEFLMGLLDKVDAVESGGDETLRTRRRHLVGGINGELNRLERWKKDQESKAADSTPATEVADPTPSTSGSSRSSSESTSSSSDSDVVIEEASAEPEGYDVPEEQEEFVVLSDSSSSSSSEGSPAPEEKERSETVEA